MRAHGNDFWSNFICNVCRTNGSRSQRKLETKSGLSTNFQQIYNLKSNFLHFFSKLEGWKEMGRSAVRMAKTFAVVGVVYAATECTVEKVDFLFKNQVLNLLKKSGSR